MDAPQVGANRAALERQVEAMATGPEHAALVEGLRSLADVVDHGFDEKAWREYRLMLTELREACAGDDTDALQGLFDKLRAPVSDSEDAGA